MNPDEKLDWARRTPKKGPLGTSFQYGFLDPPEGIKGEAKWRDVGEAPINEKLGKHQMKHRTRDSWPAEFFGRDASSCVAD
jgi:hypothetical protein